MSLNWNDPQSVQDAMTDALHEYDVAQTGQAKAFKRQAMARFERDKYEAKTWLVAKEQDTDNGRPPSNDWVAMEIKDDGDYQELQADYIEEKSEYELQLAKVESLKYKLEVLRTVAATQRVEIAHQLNS